jgi:hypothetical protein
VWMNNQCNGSTAHESGVERTAASAVHGRIRFDETTPQ